MSKELETKEKSKVFRLASDEVICIGGMRGTGKTTLAKHIASKFEARVIFDPWVSILNFLILMSPEAQA